MPFSPINASHFASDHAGLPRVYAVCSEFLYTNDNVRAVGATVVNASKGWLDMVRAIFSLEDEPRPSLEPELVRLRASFQRCIRTDKPWDAGDRADTVEMLRRHNACGGDDLGKERIESIIRLLMNAADHESRS